MKMKFILYALVLLYVIYFSTLTILRMKDLYASYYDLGIMHQTVHNTYRALKTGDISRVMELTDPHGFNQIKRMAIHNDLTLAFLAPFYFLYDSPITLLIIQTIVVGFGAWFIYHIVLQTLENRVSKEWWALTFAFAYLMHPTLQRANIYDFHAVTLASTWLLGMFYFWTTKKYGWSIVFFLLSIFSKEQVALTTTMFGLYVLLDLFRNKKSKKDKLVKKEFQFGMGIVAASIVWFIVSVFIIIPYFRGGDHFATARYGDLGDSPTSIIVGFFTNPSTVMKYIFHPDTWRYFWYLLGPVGFTSLFSPLHLLIATPEFAINLLSKNWNMRNIIYHYTAVLEPFIFISAIYGIKRVTSYKLHVIKSNWFVLLILVPTLLFSYYKGPLLYSREKESYALWNPKAESIYAKVWSDKLSDDNIKVSTTGHLAPYFTSRRYFYDFSDTYTYADYVIITTNEVRESYDRERYKDAYVNLSVDPRYQIIDKQGKLEVYKKVLAN